MNSELIDLFYLLFTISKSWCRTNHECVPFFTVLWFGNSFWIENKILHRVVMCIALTAWANGWEEVVRTLERVPPGRPAASLCSNLLLEPGPCFRHALGYHPCRAVQSIFFCQLRIGPTSVHSIHGKAPSLLFWGLLASEWLWDYGTGTVEMLEYKWTERKKVSVQISTMYNTWMSAFQSPWHHRVFAQSVRMRNQKTHTLQSFPL